MWEIIGNIFRALRPSMDGDPLVQYHWRLSVFTTLVVVVLVGCASLAWAQGALARFGLPGVATTKDVSDLDMSFASRASRIEDQQRNLELLIVESSLRGAVKDRCGGDNDAIDSYIASLEFRYRQLTGYQYTEQPCPPRAP